MADETTKDIAADLRARADRAEAAVGFPTVESENDRRLADRIEAAAKREATAKESLAVGNAAAMRAALESVVKYLGDIIPTRREIEIVKAARAALAEPARNCDRFGDDDDAFAAWHDSLNDGDVVSVRNALRWLFAKAEGGAK